MKTRLIVTTILAGGVVLAVGGAIALAGKPKAPDLSLYPDLRTVVPTHLNLVNAQQRELLRFSNGIANTGGGPWALRPDPPIGTALITNAIQEIRSSNAPLCGTQKKPSDPCSTVVTEQLVSTFEYHPTHNHWHTAGVAQFAVRKGAPNGPIVGDNSPKVGFCLLDFYNLTGNAPTSEKVFWDCYTGYQGITVGWVDQYHHALDGQELDLTDAPNGDDYYLVSTANPTGAFLEQDTTNNTAWVRFILSADSNGNRKVTVTGDHSPCESPGMCGERSPNR
jgi:hypothetical protein